jgi:hypothetical protein
MTGSGIEHKVPRLRVIFGFALNHVSLGMTEWWSFGPESLGMTGLGCVLTDISLRQSALERTQGPSTSHDCRLRLKSCFARDDKVVVIRDGIARDDRVVVIRNGIARDDRAVVIRSGAARDDKWGGKTQGPSTARDFRFTQITFRSG